MESEDASTKDELAAESGLAKDGASLIVVTAHVRPLEHGGSPVAAASANISTMRSKRDVLAVLSRDERSPASPRSVRLAWPATCLAAIILVLAACGTTTQGGGDGGGDGASTGGASEPGKLCGTEGGPACAIGTPCAPGTSHCRDADFNSTCQTIGTDCLPLEVPVCEGLGSCGVGAADPLACACNGNVVSRGCAEQISKDPALCSDGKFACGDTQCRNWIEVCVESESPETEFQCESAAARGCARYGIAQCGCLTFDASQECSGKEGGGTFIRANNGG